MITAQKLDFRELMQHIYAAFNERDIDRAFEVVHPHADWANGMEGGMLQGHDEIRAYWSRQWSYINWYVTPMSIDVDTTGHCVVDVHQIIRDLSGNIISIKDVQHVFNIEDGLIKNMRIAS